MPVPAGAMTAPVDAICPPELGERFAAPAGWRWSSIVSPHGVRLRYGWAAPAGEIRATIVLVTGFNECGEKYFETIGDLLARHCAVWQLDWRGQGGSERYFADRERIGAMGFQHDAADLQHFVDAQVLPGSRRPLVLIAHSTGGQIAIRLLQRQSGTFDGVILSAPLFALDQRGWPEWLARGLARLAVMAGLGDRYIPGARRWQDQAPRAADGTSRTSSDPIRDRVQRAWARANPHLRCGGATFAWLDAAYRSFSATDDPAVWRSIRTPILIGSAGLDSFVRPEAHRLRSRQLPHCTLIEFPTAQHELFMESEAIREHWFAAIDAFIAGLRAIPPAEPGPDPGVCHHKL